MRELLDNKRRAEAASTWYLKTYLETLIEMVRAVPGWQGATDAEAFALVYQLLGAINYFAVSQPTLEGIFGAAKLAEIDAAFPARLAALMDAAFRR